MSFALIPAEFACDTRLNRSDWRVFVGLASFADAESRTCWPSRKALSLACGISSLALISGALQRLERYGWIEIRHRRGSSFYRLLDGLGSSSPRHVPQAVHPGMDTEQTTEQINLYPSPAPATEPAQVEREKAKIDSEAPERPCEPLVVPKSGKVEDEAENGSESVSEASVNDSEAAAVIMALIAASGAKYSTKPGSGPVRAAEQALNAGYSVDDLRLVIAFCASTWSNPRFLTPSAVLKVSRLDERLAQAQASAPAGTRQQAHKLFKREPEPERSDPSRVREHLSKLKAALAA